jgi:hypothetical protein
MTVLARTIEQSGEFVSTYIQLGNITRGSKHARIHNIDIEGS